MKNRLAALGMAALSACLITSAFAANRGVSFTGIGFHPDPGPFPASNIYSMNPEGTVFMASPAWFGNYCFEWTRENGWGTEIGEAASACRISSNGTIMASGVYPGESYAWPGTWAGAPNVWDPIPPPAGYEPCDYTSQMSFFDMGGDGDFATGLTWEGCGVARAFRWDKSTNTTVNLGSLNGESSRGNAISNDGNTVAGWTSTQCGMWRGTRWDNGSWSWIDGQGTIEPKTCVSSGGGCCWDGDCAEYVDDAYCDRATCTDGVCAGGPFAGNSCSDSWECAGFCIGGPSDGNDCTDDYYCPDTPVCVDNPAWTWEAYKGEGRDVSDSGHVVGETFGVNSVPWDDPNFDLLLELSGYIQNPDGSFTQIPPPSHYLDRWDPQRISEDGKVVVGRVGNPFFGAIPAFWSGYTGTQDLQLFLVQQGLDELFFWYLLAANDVSADGTVIAGSGINPDGQLEGFIVDLKKVWVCHAPPGSPGDARTLGVSLDSVGDHVAHGDYLGTCEFMNSGGLSRALGLRERLKAAAPSIKNVPDPFLLGGGGQVERPTSSVERPQPLHRSKAAGKPNKRRR